MCDSNTFETKKFKRRYMSFASKKSGLLLIGICIAGLSACLVWVREEMGEPSFERKSFSVRDEAEHALAYLNLDHISEMRMSIGPGDFNAPVRNSISIQPERALRILEAVGEPHATDWPQDTEMWVESLVMIVINADNRMQRVSVFQRIQNNTPYLIVIGLRCYMLTDSDLLLRVFKIAEIPREILAP
jgi:hypothetical protein